MGEYKDVIQVGKIEVFGDPNKSGMRSKSQIEFFISIDQNPDIFKQSITDGVVEEKIRVYGTPEDAASDQTFAIFIAAQNTAAMDEDESETYTIWKTKNPTHYIYFPESGKVMLDADDDSEIWICQLKTKCDEDVFCYTYGYGITPQDAFKDCDNVKAGLQKSYNIEGRKIVINGQKQEEDEIEDFSSEDDEFK